MLQLPELSFATSKAEKSTVCVSPAKRSQCACLVWRTELFWSQCLKIREQRPDNVNPSSFPCLCGTFTRSSGKITEKYLSLMILEVVVMGKNSPGVRMWWLGSLQGTAGWHWGRKSLPVPPSHHLGAGCRKNITDHARPVGRRFVVHQVVRAAFSKPVHIMSFTTPSEAKSTHIWHAGVGELKWALCPEVRGLIQNES